LVHKERQENMLAEVRQYCGRSYLIVCGYVVAFDGDPCRDLKLITDEGVPIDEAFTRRDAWNIDRLTRVADAINRSENSK
jgi:hypothetical protein